MSQIGLPFDWAGQGGEAGLIVSAANALAVGHIENWRNWTIPVTILSGPPRSGRTTLARHFAHLSGGVVRDDVEGCDEQSLFHAWNIAVDSARPLLLVAREVPARWTVALPDLRSRIAAAHHARIEEPDDALVRALLESGLARAGSAFAADVPGWLASRIERSYGAVAQVLGHLNQYSLSQARKISVQSAKEALQAAGYLLITSANTMPDRADGE